MTRKTYTKTPAIAAKQLIRVVPRRILRLLVPGRNFTRTVPERSFTRVVPHRQLAFLNTANRTEGYWPLAFVNWGQDNILPFDPADVNYDKTFDELEAELP